MKKTQSQLRLALFFTALALLALVALAVRASNSFDRLAAAGPLFDVGSLPSYLAALSAIVAGGGLYGGLAAASPLRSVASIVGYLATLSFLVTGGFIAVRAALQPGGWGGKLLHVLPFFCVGLLLAGVILQVAGLGTLGGFTMGWLIVSALLSLLAVLVALARVSLDAGSLKAAIGALTVGLGLLTLLVIIIGAGTLRLVFNPPSATGTAVQAAQSSMTLQFQIIGVCLLILGVLAWVTTVRAWRALRGTSAEASPPAPLDYRREAGRALICCAGLALVAGLAIQLVPVAHSNPPVQTPPRWDSPQTEQLFKGACADCHSNETVYPWYAYIAPGSWLLASHIRAAHARWNISELNHLAPGDKSSLPDRIADQLDSDSMPPKDYRLMHPAARLSAAQKALLLNALKAVISR
jgi:mono/diheme cytochrome c family protein